MGNFTCPMHPHVTSPKPESCPECGMKLVKNDNNSHHPNTGKPNNHISTYHPLLVIIGLILLTSTIATLHSTTPNPTHFFRSFMAGFFITFSGFKLLDLKGFSEGYQAYDLLASKLPIYGYIYPFIELSLGLSYLINFAPTHINIITFGLMTFSGLGIINAKRKKHTFECACLGTIIKLPLTSVTLVEDFGMAAMALAMLYFL